MKIMKNRKNRVIALLTDFGLTDEYVGVIKGVILSHCPGATLVDINHHLPKHNIKAGARMLAASHLYFPPATVHLVVVDPGVGTDRRILCILADNQYFIGPDNGVLTPALSIPGAQCYTLKPPQSAAASATFHGRDLMAPIAGKIATDHTNLTKLCTPVPCVSCHSVQLNTNERVDCRITGEVLSIDHFGNIATSISKQEVQKLGRHPQFSIAGKTIRGLNNIYADVTIGELVALIDSRGFVEISVNCQSAATMLGITTGDVITAETR